MEAGWFGPALGLLSRGGAWVFSIVLILCRHKYDLSWVTFGVSLTVCALWTWGCVLARKAHSGFQAALVLCVGRAVAICVGQLGPAGISTLMSSMGILAAVAATGFVCVATGELLTQKGETKLARQGDILWRVFVFTTVVLSLLDAVVLWVPGWKSGLYRLFMEHEAIALGSMGTVLVLLIASIVTITWKMVFYYRASRALLGRTVKHNNR